MEAPQIQQGPAAFAPYQLQLHCPATAAAEAHHLLVMALAETALDAWFTVALPMTGPWSLWWDDTQIWAGEHPDPGTWTEVLLEGWWGAGGGCC